MLFEKGNKMAEKPPRVVIRKFLEMLDNAKKDDNILCFQDACMSIGWRTTKVDYWVNKKPVFEVLKKSIQDVIVSRINKGALTGERNGGTNATASIWRMKQLGEKDISEVNNNNRNIEPPVVKFDD